MSVEKFFEEVLSKTDKICNYWKDNDFSSKAVRGDVKFNFFGSTKTEPTTKFAYFYALDNRIQERYNNFWKILVWYFPWRKENKLLSHIKQFLGCVNNLDSKSIILTKIEGLVNGDNCFAKSDNEAKKGLRLQNVVQDKFARVKGKDSKVEVNFSNEAIKEVKNAKDNKTRQDFGLDDVEFVPVEKESKKVSSEPDFYNLNPDLINNDKLVESDDIVASNDCVPKRESEETRERLEIPRDDLLKINTQSNQNKEVIKSNLQRTEQNSNKIIDNISRKNSDFGIKINNNLADNKRKTENENLQYDMLKNNISKSDVANKQKDSIRPEDNINKYSSKNSLNNNANNYKISELQKSKIAGDEIAKMSEKDMQAIKDYMQAELNKQMNIAEEKGEVYKMPLSIKEVINHKVSEKSEIQTNKVDDPILNNKK